MVADELPLFLNLWKLKFRKRSNSKSPRQTVLWCLISGKMGWLCGYSNPMEPASKEVPWSFWSLSHPESGLTHVVNGTSESDHKRLLQLPLCSLWDHALREKPAAILQGGSNGGLKRKGVLPPMATRGSQLGSGSSSRLSLQMRQPQLTTRLPQSCERF